MKKFICIFCMLLFSSFTFSQEALQWRGDARDGKYPDKNLLKKWPADGPELLWHYDDLGVGHGSATLTKDFIYVAGTPDNITYVYAFSHDGELKWKSEVGEDWTVNYDGVRTTPQIDNGKIYIMSAYGQIVCMDTKNGKHLWKVNILKDYDGRNIRWGLCENFAIDGKKLFVTVGGEDANVIALNKNNGELIWKASGNGEKSAYNSPLIFERGGKTILVTMTEKSINGFDTENGEHLWSHEHPNRWSVHANTPLYKDGKLFCFSGYERGAVMLEVAKDGKSVKQLWNNTKLNSNYGGAVLDKGKIYMTGHQRVWNCIDWETGNIDYTLPSRAAANIIMAEDLLYVYDERGNVCLVKPTGTEFKIISEFKVPYGIKQHWAHLVIGDQKLLVRHGGSLMVYDIAAN